MVTAAVAKCGSGRLGGEDLVAAFFESALNQAANGARIFDEEDRFATGEVADRGCGGLSFVVGRRDGKVDREAGPGARDGFDVDSASTLTHDPVNRS